MDHQKLKKNIDVQLKKYEERLEQVDRVRVTKIEMAFKGLETALFELNKFKKDVLPRLEELELKVVKIQGEDDDLDGMELDGSGARMLNRLQTYVKKL